MFYYAVVKAVELVGEAATNVTAASQSELRSIPWRQITGMRNVLVHDFNNIDKNMLWEAIRVDMPNLIANLEIVLVLHEG